jgi:hypothetical protein
VYAHERCAELALEQPQGILDQVLAAQVPHGGVFLVGEEVLHLLQRDQAQPVAPPCGDVTAARAGRGECLQLRTGEAAGTGEGGGELLLAHRFQQVADGVRVEGFDRVLIVGGGEDHRRRLLQHVQVARGLEPVHAGHAHIEQHHIGREVVGVAERLGAVGGLADHLDVTDLGEQAAQPLACRRLVIDDQHLQPERLGHGLRRAPRPQSAPGSR